MEKILVGTSGWAYSWNKGRSLKWYIKNTPFKTVEVNASFYRFLSQKTVNSWAKIIEDKKFYFSVKVHRSITHIYRLKLEKTKPLWERFLESFKPIDSKTLFYLFQMPPSFKATEENINRLIEFYKFTNLGKRFAFEPRNITWYDEKVLNILEDLGLTMVSISAPSLPDRLFNFNRHFYMRFHGKETWYFYNYSHEELKNFVHKILNMEFKIGVVYFNNAEYMYKNAIGFVCMFNREGV